ncbi:carbohydrate ABC transporter permease [Ktedonospora formicarum]|uniref:Sugar ABC transporter permease n=1 Tax=Ktedonospora formicarum TaxID=2778364 RepID=A0A8J3I6N5_9CHLR|nr:sugar ABC transporter permease [Ktedonospora formicarum]GHO48391.1 sugar ABC transporter permease [Ktedonospora formicarum]
MQVISRPPASTDADSVQLSTQTRRKKSRRVGTLLLFLLPSLVLYFVFILFPVVQAIYYSFYRWSGFGPLTDFIGLKNYVTAFQNTTFVAAFVHNIEILVLSLIFQLTLSFILALVIGKTLPGRAIFRTIFFMPFILSEVIAGYIWMFIYNPNGGLVNVALQHIIPGFQSQEWLGNPNIVLLSIFVAMIWKYFGLHLVLFGAAIQNIPDEIVEAARIDGASIFQVVRYVTLPLLGSTVRLSIFLSALGSLQYFDLIWIMSNGGPVHASETMSTYLYKAGFQSFQLGYGSAVGVIMMLICFVFSILYQRFIMQRDLAGSLTAAEQV